MNAHGALKSFGERIERLDAEIKVLNSDKAEIYAEAKGIGFDVKVLKLAIRAKKEIEDNPAAVQERDSMVEIYLAALFGQDTTKSRPAPVSVAGKGLPSQSLAHTHEDHNPETGEITESQPHGSEASAAVEGDGERTPVPVTTNSEPVIPLAGSDPVAAVDDQNLSIRTDLTAAISEAVEIGAGEIPPYLRRVA